MLFDDATRHAAVVLREDGRELVSGAPWRTQAVLEDADPLAPAGMTAGDADWLFRGAGRIAGRFRLRMFLPHATGRATAEHPAGATILVRLAGRAEEEIFADMGHGRRRRVRKCLREGYEVRDDVAIEVERSFRDVVDDTHERRHDFRPATPDEAAAAGEAWRDWELPWHWLLWAAGRDGALVAGLGSGRIAGGMVDTRSSGSTEAALRDGVNVLLVWEAMRRARAGGHAWINLGGSSGFKQEFGGVTMPLWCRLGGGPEWLAPNLIENLTRGEGRRAARAVRAWVTQRSRAPSASS